MKKLAVSLAVSAFLAFTSFAAVAGQHEGHEGPPAGNAVKSGIFKDPVCGMDVTIKGAKYMCEYKKKKYYFCSEEEMKKFKESPAKYLNKKTK